MVALAAMILVGKSSDRRRERRCHAAVPLLIEAVAFVLLAVTQTESVFLSVVLWCLVASDIECSWSPIWSLPNEFLAGFSAPGIALINSFGNLGGFVGPYAMGVIMKMTGNSCGGLLFASISWLVSAILLIALPKTTDGRAARFLSGEVP